MSSLMRLTNFLACSGISSQERHTYNSEFELKNNLPSFDRLIHDCICMRIYDIDEINTFLIKNGYKERLGSKTLI